MSLIMQKNTISSWLWRGRDSTWQDLLNYGWCKELPKISQGKYFVVGMVAPEQQKHEEEGERLARLIKKDDTMKGSQSGS